MHLDSKLLSLCVLLAGLALSGAAAADEPVTPHYASIRRGETNLREGPGYSYPILWVYKRKDYPLFVISGYGNWRHVRDADGTMGWMHETQLSDRRSVLFGGHAKAPLWASADRTAKAVAYAAPGVVAWLKACEPLRCEVEVRGVEGWAAKTDLWGVEPGEVFQ